MLFDFGHGIGGARNWSPSVQALACHGFPRSSAKGEVQEGHDLSCLYRRNAKNEERFLVSLGMAKRVVREKRYSKLLMRAFRRTQRA
jgi:hypothetical protein